MPKFVAQLTVVVEDAPAEFEAAQTLFHKAMGVGIDTKAVTVFPLNPDGKTFNYFVSTHFGASDLNED